MHNYKQNKPFNLADLLYRENVSFVCAWMQLPSWNYVCMNKHK